MADSWQDEWPGEEGPWWFYGYFHGESQKTLNIVMIHKTVNVPPQYLGFSANHFMDEEEYRGKGKWLKMELPELPEPV